MKGLFVKDLKLMMLQKNFLLLILAIVIGMRDCEKKSVNKILL